jgi:hypothetical protein
MVPMKNKFYIIIAIIFILLILGKLYYFKDIEEAFSLPRKLQIINVVGLFFIFVSLVLIIFKPILARIFIILGVLSGYFECAWKYMLDEISIFYLVFLIFGISFFSFFLWFCASAELGVRKDENTPTELKYK